MFIYAPLKSWIEMKIHFCMTGQSISSKGVNISEQKSGTKRTKKQERRESAPAHGKIHTKRHLVFLVTARVDN